MDILEVGAGRAVIPYSQEMFPNYREKYTGVHDDSYVQVIILEQNETFAIAAVGTVINSEPDKIAERVSEVTGIPADHILIHAKHVLSAPHASRKDTKDDYMEKAPKDGYGEITEEEAEEFVKRNHMLCDALLDAAGEAAQKAADSIRPAVMKYACGHTDINVNRLVYTDKGWWQGHNPDIPADESLPVLRFDDTDGNPIAILFFCNVAPGVLENSFLEDGSRPTSGDLAAEAERRIDNLYDGVVSIYLTAATGDHWQALRALHDTLDKDGHQTVTDLHETGFIFVDILADRLKEAVVKAAEDSKEQNTAGGLHLDRFSFSYDGVKAQGAKRGQPATYVEYVKTDKQELGLDILRIGRDTVVLFTGVELNAGTWNAIRQGSPFRNTMIVGFANDKGGGYLPEMDYYDKVTYQSLKTRYFAGTAEKYAEDAVKTLNELY